MTVVEANLTLGGLNSPANHNLKTPFKFQTDLPRNKLLVRNCGSSHFQNKWLHPICAPPQFPKWKMVDWNISWSDLFMLLKSDLLHQLEWLRKMCEKVGAQGVAALGKGGCSWRWLCSHLGGSINGIHQQQQPPYSRPWYCQYASRNFIYY